MLAKLLKELSKHFRLITSVKYNKKQIKMSKNGKNEPPHQSDESSDEEASGSAFDLVSKFLKDKLRLDDDSNEPKEKVLTEFTLDAIVEFMNSNKCKRIITMAGAGISTSAGIPDFRSPVHGLYHNLQKYNLPHPQAIFELEFFRENPKPFFELAKELYPGTFKPTKCHYFIKLLHEKGYLLRHYTQNIDTLERVAGIPEEKLVEAHGTFYKGHCLECRKEYTLEWMKEKIFADVIPICEDCPGIVKPDIVFFGEQLPDKFFTCMTKDFQNCDLLIILGSSLAVQPFASLIDQVSDTCPRLLINREKAGHRTGLMSMMGMGGGLCFDSKKNTRDVCWLGDCDNGCFLLAEKLGWKDELIDMLGESQEESGDETKTSTESKLGDKKSKKSKSDAKQGNQSEDTTSINNENKL